MSFIENLQNKPKKTRVLILWTASISVVLVITIIWLAGFSRNAKPKEELEQTQLPSLFESIKKDISTLKQGLNAGVKDITNQINENEGE